YLLLAGAGEEADLPAKWLLEIGAPIGAGIFAPDGPHPGQLFGDRQNLIGREAPSRRWHARGRDGDRGFGVARFRRGGRGGRRRVRGARQRRARDACREARVGAREGRRQEGRRAGENGRQGAHHAAAKCASTSGAMSRIAHWAGSGSGSSTPWRIRAPSESLACSEPWLPPPTWACRPQSMNSWPGAAESRTSPEVGQVSADQARESASG